MNNKQEQLIQNTNSLRSAEQIETRLKGLKLKEKDLMKVYDDAFAKYLLDFEILGGNAADETECVSVLNRLLLVRVQIMQLEWVLNLRF
jgi:alcohol dehydrogenase class IV